MKRTELMDIFRSYAEPRRHSFRNHRHSAFEISYISDGEGIYQVGKRVFDIKSGDIFIYCTNEPHCITDISGECPMKLVNIHFEPRYVWGMTDGNAYMQTIFGRSSKGENRLREDDPLYTAIRDRILEAEKEWTESKVGSSEMVRACISEILVLLTRNEDAELHISLHRQNENKLALLSRSMDYICEHLTEPLKLDTLAKQANLGRTYYCTEFKSLNGVTPWEYINIKRVEKSLTLLRRGNSNILNVALACGFNNTANFNKIFRKVTGLTPGEYRRTGNIAEK